MEEHRREDYYPISLFETLLLDLEDRQKNPHIGRGDELVPYNDSEAVEGSDLTAAMLINVWATTILENQTWKNKWVTKSDLYQLALEEAPWSDLSVRKLNDDLYVIVSLLTYVESDE